MKKIKIYEYPNCSTCKKALKFLEKQAIGFEKINITENPPTKNELKTMLKIYAGDLKRLLNTSGQLYREMNLSGKLPKMSQDEVIELLAKHGKLIKRPFLLSDSQGLLGFKESEWKNLFMPR